MEGRKAQGMHLVPATAVKLQKSRVLSIPGVKTVSAIDQLLVTIINLMADKVFFHHLPQGYALRQGHSVGAPRRIPSGTNSHPSDTKYYAHRGITDGCGSEFVSSRRDDLRGQGPLRRPPQGSPSKYSWTGNWIPSSVGSRYSYQGSNNNMPTLYSKQPMITGWFLKVKQVSSCPNNLS